MVWLGVLADRQGDLTGGLGWYEEAAALGDPTAPEIARARRYRLRPGFLPWPVRCGHKVGRTIFKGQPQRRLRKLVN
jgi:hypothetical protein